MKRRPLPSYSPVVEAEARTICERHGLNPDEQITFHHPRLGVFDAPVWWDFTGDATDALREQAAS
ncbi:hypothetical protein [Nesterenkonia sp. HG001]|uniref:hypothetical protein n=1 Tax=Nesterenkonia sp. HG001 TaxID=2983207 RepID=UPI002AC71E13|nr:hypothetical protein [Nesterenkonia sp. HG001]MDZ5076769.1 hypothetical protein [Nesterenkonia sp. HG001]